MAKKRKSDATRLDEAERSIYSSFCSAANSLSQIYTQAMNHQKLSFQAGERHGMEKIYQWILRQHEETSRVTTADIVAYLQNELDCGGDDASMSPRFQAPHPTVCSPNPSIFTSSVFSGQAAPGLGSPAAHIDQTKNSVFSNALSSPIRSTLQSYHHSQGGGCYPDGPSHSENVSRSNDASPFNHKDPNSNDSSMDMHSDSTC